MKRPYGIVKPCHLRVTLSGGEPASRSRSFATQEQNRGAKRRWGLLTIFHIPCAEKKRTFGVSMRFDFLPVGTGVLDGPKNEKLFNLQPAIICSRIKSKICCFPGRRGRRPLQGLRKIERKSVATKFTVISILDRRGDHRSSALKQAKFLRHFLLTPWAMTSSL